MRNSYARRLAALEGAQKAAAPAWSLPVSIVEHDEDGKALRVVREVPTQPARPFDCLAVVAELWGEKVLDSYDL
jgi:hypothetical protein